jgi:RimJ/RimL family protein N-acetyltransferase
MGMIYTPEKFRGQGYATSLAAFQIDHMLTRDGIALAQIRWNNVPSQRIMDKFGARRTREPLTHGVFYWK